MSNDSIGWEEPISAMDYMKMHRDKPEDKRLKQAQFRLYGDWEDGGCDVHHINDWLGVQIRLPKL